MYNSTKSYHLMWLQYDQLSTKRSDMLNKYAWDVKKCKSKKNRQLKSLILNKVKKFSYVTHIKNFYYKGKYATIYRVFSQPLLAMSTL